jgi:hypothetical protein
LLLTVNEEKTRIWNYRKGSLAQDPNHGPHSDAEFATNPANAGTLGAS